MKLHGGIGFEVPYVDYMEGRLTGIYKPNYSKQKSSPKYNTYPDNNLYNPNTRPNTSSFLFSSYANPFMQYGRSEGVYPSGSDSIFYFDQSYKAMKPSSLLPPSQDPLTLMTIGYFEEFGRQLARETFSATTTTPQSNLQSSLNQDGLGNNLIMGIQQKQDIFGYRFKICKDCLLTDPLKVWFGKDGTKNNNNNHNYPELVTRLEQKHECDPKLIASNTKVLDKEGSIKAMIDELPANSIKVTKTWIENQNNRCSLIAIKIPHKNSNNDDNIEYNADDDDNTIQPEQENIILPDPKNPKQKITFQYSKEKHIQLSLTPNETSKNHWAARAIKDGHTILTNDEMEDFLRKVQHASTFAIFKIRIPSTTITASSSIPPSLQKQRHHQQQHESVGLYFLAILPQSRDETFSSLYDHLVNISNFTIPVVNSQPSSSSSSSS